MSTLQTPRLSLWPWHPRHLLTLIEAPERFEEEVGLSAAPGMRDFLVSEDVSPEWVQALRSAQGADPWHHGFAVVETDAQVIVGTAGFKGAADAEGRVEIAYGIVPTREGRGYATEAAAALIRFAEAAGVRRILAHTLAEANASTRVLTKCGFRQSGEVVDPDDGPLWRWEREAWAREEDPRAGGDPAGD